MTTAADPDNGMPSRAALAQECLVFRMQQLSETFYSAGWIEDLEFEVWEMAHEKPARFADNAVSKDMARSFRHLATLAGGWWVYEDETQPGSDQGPVFVSMTRWQEILKARNAGKKG